MKGQIFITFIFFCILYSAHAQNNLIPKYLHECTQDDLDLLREGYMFLRGKGIMDYYANIHAMHFGMAHDDPREFFPFHGQMISQMNSLLGEYDSRLRIPIWDITYEREYPREIYYVTRGWPEIRRTMPPGSPLRANEGYRASNLPYHFSLVPFSNACADIHNDVHNYYGGTFGSPWSPADPMFWSFHAFWDDVYDLYLTEKGLSRGRSTMPINYPQL